MSLTLALGLSQQALLTQTALSLTILLLQHSNLRFDFGALDILFNTNSLHADIIHQYGTMAPRIPVARN